MPDPVRRYCEDGEVPALPRPAGVDGQVVYPRIDYRFLSIPLPWKKLRSFLPYVDSALALQFVVIVLPFLHALAKDQDMAVAGAPMPANYVRYHVLFGDMMSADGSVCRPSPTLAFLSFAHHLSPFDRELDLVERDFNVRYTDLRSALDKAPDKVPHFARKLQRLFPSYSSAHGDDLALDLGWSATIPAAEGTSADDPRDAAAARPGRRWGAAPGWVDRIPPPPFTDRARASEALMQLFITLASSENPIPPPPALSLARCAADPGLFRCWFTRVKETLHWWDVSYVLYDEGSACFDDVSQSVALRWIFASVEEKLRFAVYGTLDINLVGVSVERALRSLDQLLQGRPP